MPEQYSIAIRSYGYNAPKMTLPASPYARDMFLADIFLDKNVKEKINNRWKSETEDGILTIRMPWVVPIYKK